MSIKQEPLELDAKVNELKEKGFTVTVQRSMVLARLIDSSAHLTAEEIYEGLNDRYPSLSKATVYNSLEIFKKAGIIQELIIQKGKAHYDANPNPHPHFHCTKCGKIYDLPNRLPALKKREIDHHKVDKVKACFYGTCRDCLAS